jgi:hypothetical protein
MAKSTITLNDNFIFKFPKKHQNPTYGKESYYPDILFKHLLSSEDRIEIAHSGITSKFTDWSYKFNPLVDPFYILDISLGFCSKDENVIGGYQWEFSVPEGNKLGFSDIKKLEEDENLIYFSVIIKGEITWDFKPSHFEKIKQKMMSFSPWGEVVLNINMKLRSNFLHSRYFPEYKKGGEIPEIQQTYDNLPFILDKTPNSFTTIYYREPRINWELSEKYWMKLLDKNIIFGGKYLSPYNT